VRPVAVKTTPITRARKRAATPTRTLAVDIGGTGVKAVVLNEAGDPISKRVRARTPSPALPESVLRIVTRLAGRLGEYDRVSIGFPGVIDRGVVKLAPNLSKDWIDVNAAALFEARLGKRVRLANDADVQGFGVVAGKGVELVITLGTGVGSALFLDGKLVPNVEVGRRRLGDAGRRKIGQTRWHRRVVKFVRRLDEMFHFDRLYIGGGNAGHVDITKLPPNTRIVSNVNGLIGGVALWRDDAPVAR